MPAIALSISFGCTTAGIGFIRFTSIGGGTAGPFTYAVVGTDPTREYYGSIARSELPFTLSIPINDTYEVGVEDTSTGNASGSRTAEINCTPVSGGGG